MKRGRKRLDPADDTVNMSIRVPAHLADAMFVLAIRRRTSVSAITRAFFKRQTEPISHGKDCASPPTDGVLTT